MAPAHLSDFLRRLTRGMAAETLNEQSDRQLVARALAGNDEAALHAILVRHNNTAKTDLARLQGNWTVVSTPKDNNSNYNEDVHTKVKEEPTGKLLVGP